MSTSSTLRLYLPVVIMTSQHSTAGTVIPPYLDDLSYPVSLIGTLLSLSPVMGLVARLPAGLIYRGHRARLLMVAALTVIALCNIAYTFAAQPIAFALVHALNGLAFASATTVYLALFVDSLPTGSDRSHAMGYYSGCLAVGFSSGSFIAGYVSDSWGYVASFRVAAALALLAAAILLGVMRPPNQAAPGMGPPRDRSDPFHALKSLGALLDSKMATTMVVALFVNMLHQLGTAFFPLYGLSVGLTMTEIGIVRGLYALCNAVTRPISGFVVKRTGRHRLSYTGIPLESLVMMMVPLFADFHALGIIFIVAGLLRAVVIVANAVSLIEDTDESRVSRGVSSGIYHAAGDLGNILGPSIGGVIATFTGIAHLFFIAPPFLVLAFLTSLLGRKFFGSGASVRANL